MFVLLLNRFVEDLFSLVGENKKVLLSSRFCCQLAKYSELLKSFPSGRLVINNFA